MLRTRRLHPSLFLAGLLSIVLIIWLAETEQNLREDHAPSLPPQDADYYMENFHLSETDGQGVVMRQLSGAKLVHYNHDRTDLHHPMLTLHEDNLPRWRISASQGRLTQQYLALQDDVRIQQLNPTDRQPLQVKANNLNIDMINRASYSSGQVEITQATASILAEGMHLQFDDRRLQLQSHVRGSYVQP